MNSNKNRLIGRTLFLSFFALSFFFFVLCHILLGVRESVSFLATLYKHESPPIQVLILCRCQHYFTLYILRLHLHLGTAWRQFSSMQTECCWLRWKIWFRESLCELQVENCQLKTDTKPKQAKKVERWSENRTVECVDSSRAAQDLACDQHSG